MDRIIGRQPVISALQSGTDLERVYIMDSISGVFEKQVRALCKTRNIPLNRIPKVKFDRGVRGNHQGIYALVSEMKYWELTEMIRTLQSEHANPVILMLDGVQDVRNLGAIARSAEVFGAHGIILPSKRSAPINEVAIKTSAGALLHLKIARVKNLQDALGTIGAEGIAVIGADAQADHGLDDINLHQPLVILLGAEGRGIDRHLKIYCDHTFAIPQVGKVASLNVSVANGIILYEIFKQRKHRSS